MHTHAYNNTYYFIYVYTHITTLNYTQSYLLTYIYLHIYTGGILALIATFILKEKKETIDKINKSFTEHILAFDFIGAIGCSVGLVLILIALVQAVVSDPVLSTTRALIGLIIGGVVCGTIFIVDQFYATDPLIPPSIFYNRIYTLTTISGTLMAFVRNSITYNMIFYLQGPKEKSPLQAGIALIPFGIGM